MLYDKVKSIDLVSTGLFNSNNYLIFTLFSKYNIKNLKDFFLLTDQHFVKNPFDIVNDLVPFWYTVIDCEVKGVSDLLKHIYLNEELNIDGILKSIWKKCDISKIDTLYLIKRIRILGFSEEEFNMFVKFANSLDNKLTIGDILCLLNQNNLEDKVFSKKVSILSDYYCKIMKQNGDLVMLKELYKKLERQLNNKIDSDISNTQLIINNLEFSEKDEEVIKLVRKYDDNKK